MTHTISRSCSTVYVARTPPLSATDELVRRSEPESASAGEGGQGAGSAAETTLGSRRTGPSRPENAAQTTPPRWVDSASVDTQRKFTRLPAGRRALAGRAPSQSLGGKNGFRASRSSAVHVPTALSSSALPHFPLRLPVALTAWCDGGRHRDPPTVARSPAKGIDSWELRGSALGELECLSAHTIGQWCGSGPASRACGLRPRPSTNPIEHRVCFV